MPLSFHLRRGFTLIELLIVVVILGVLAAVLIPQFTNASDDASLSAARTQLQTLRSQIEVYRAQRGQYPTSDGSSAGGDVDGNGTVDQWDDMIDAAVIRSSPSWPPLFSDSYTAANGDLTLVLASPYYDVNADGTSDATDAGVVGTW